MANYIWASLTMLTVIIIYLSGSMILAMLGIGEKLTPVELTAAIVSPPLMLWCLVWLESGGIV